MKFFPYEKYKLISPLNPEEALKKIAAAVTTGPTSLLASSRQDKYYQGKISGYGFEITRVIGYRNSFRPLIKGEISSYLGSEIKIVMRMNKAVIIFCCVWMGSVLIAAIATLAAQVHTRKLLLPGVIPFVMLLFGYVLFTGGFKYESIKAKKFLEELFEAEEVV